MIDLRATPPPADWGVDVDPEAVEALAERWAGDAFPLPAFDYPGMPSSREVSWWFDYVTLSVSVLACLWPPDGEEVWRTELDGQWLGDAPGIFAVFTRQLMVPSGLGLERVAALSDAEGAAWFVGEGTLQQIPQRVALLRQVAAAVLDRWNGSVANLVVAADREGPRMVELLVETIPGFQDRPHSSAGVLPFDKLAHLAAAIMAAGLGWGAACFTGFDDFPVYPDYMLPRVFRHHGVLVYSPEVAGAVDARLLIPALSEAEHAIRWATVYAGEALRSALAQRGRVVPAPALDYRLWSEAVLGPDADAFGEHHRTLTMAY